MNKTGRACLIPNSEYPHYAIKEPATASFEALAWMGSAIPCAFAPPNRWLGREKENRVAQASACANLPVHLDAATGA